eukprot:SAG22_NODE_7125_length_773_cov_0.973294_2_plen_110_part_00
MIAARDKENCFRLAELGISASDVTVLGKPVWIEPDEDADGRIAIVPPDPPANIGPPRFHFRILRGHTIENLLKHREESLKVYLGFAAMGACALLFGEELTRNSIVVSYE